MRYILLLFCYALISQIVLAQEQLNYYDTLNIGGIKQVIAVNGKKEGPVLLFLHGGPGESRIPDRDKFTNLLQQQFCVVIWDQRGTGSTRQLNEAPLSFSLIHADTKELTEKLRQQFHQDKIYLMGESSGTLLAFQLAATHPNYIKAVLAVCPVINQGESERLALDSLKRWAVNTHQPQALAELNTVHYPFHTMNDLYYSRKWMNEISGRPFPAKDTTRIKTYLEAWCKDWLGPWNEAVEPPVAITIKKLDCPVYFFLGGKDIQTNAFISKRYFDQLKAPKKKMFWFKDDGHLLMITNAGAVQQAILDKVLPVLQ